MRVTMLGCGSSAGVPFIGCDCPVCTSDNPKNKRLRVSLLIELGETTLLIDTSPDLRQQALRHNIRKVDAVLYTHDHADHTNGLDDLRSFNFLSNKAMPIYGTSETLRLTQQRFPYAFLPKPEKIWYRPAVTPHVLPDAAIHSFNVGGIDIIAFEQIHGKVTSLGYRIGDFAYSTDVNALTESAFEALRGTKTWIVDCMRRLPSPTHAHLPITLGWIERVKPELAIFTHMDHSFDYDGLLSELPSGVVPGYDGMVLEL